MINQKMKTPTMNSTIVSSLAESSGGVANYTRNMVASLKYFPINITVISEITTVPEERNRIASTQGWRKGYRYIFDVFKLVKSAQSKIVHFQHEFFLYGGIASALLFPFLLASIRLLDRKIIVTLHGIIPLGNKTSNFARSNMIKVPTFALKIGSLFVTRLIALFSNIIIVHENYFKTILEREYKIKPEKIAVIPHGIEQIRVTIPQHQAKERLGLANKTVIFTFGYLSKYKGIELLIKSFLSVSDRHRDWVLVIGGGPHPRLAKSKGYAQYLDTLKRLSKPIENKVRFVGFIPESEIEVYCTAADLMVFPYTVAMSSSGPLNLCYALKKPFLASDLPNFVNPMFPKDVYFKCGSQEDLATKMERLLTNDDIMQVIREKSAEMAMTRAWDNVTAKTYRLYLSLTEDSH